MSFATSPHDSPRRALLIGWLRYALFIFLITGPPRTISGQCARRERCRRPLGARSNGVLRDPGTVSHDAKVAFEGEIGYHSSCTYTDIGHSWGVGPKSVWPFFHRSLERI